MNTPATPRFAPTVGLMHESVRTAVATNRNPETGSVERVLSNSRLTLSWEAGELKVRCACSRVQLSGEAPDRAARRGRMT